MNNLMEAITIHSASSSSSFRSRTSLISPALRATSESRLMRFAILGFLWVAGNHFEGLFQAHSLAWGFAIPLVFGSGIAHVAKISVGRDGGVGCFVKGCAVGDASCGV
jgi:hypothetical protein